MDDPFKPKNDQLIREAKIGLIICALLIGLFAYAAWNRLTGNWNQLPEHVRNAPVAENIAESYRQEVAAKRDAERDAAIIASRAQKQSSESNFRTPRNFGAGEIVRAQSPDLPSFSDRQGSVRTTVVTPGVSLPARNQNSGELRELTFNDLRSPANPQNTNTSQVSQNRNQNDPFASAVVEPIQQVGFDRVENGPQIVSEVQQPGGGFQPLSNFANQQQSRTKFSAEQPQQEDKPSAFSSEESKTFNPLPNPDAANSGPKRESKYDADSGANEQVETEPKVNNQSAASIQKVDLNPKSFQPASFSRQNTPSSPTNSSISAQSIVKQSTRFQVRVEPAEDITAATYPPDTFTEKSSFPVSDYGTEQAGSILSPQDSPEASVAILSNNVTEPASTSFVRDSKDLPTESAYTPNTLIEQPKAKAIEQPGTYAIGQGETLWSIAEKAYGDPRLFRAIFESNRNAIPDPNQLVAGSKIRLLELTDLVTRYHEFVPADLLPDSLPGIYRTREGDTLFHVARQQLGQASRFAELLDLNKSRLAPGTHQMTSLPSGMVLHLPQSLVVE